jgi:hypothetical protein
MWVMSLTVCRPAETGQLFTPASFHATEMQSSIRSLLGSRIRTTSPYLAKEDGNDLYLNMIDPEQPLFQTAQLEKRPCGQGFCPSKTGAATFY